MALSKPTTPHRARRIRAAVRMMTHSQLLSVPFVLSTIALFTLDSLPVYFGKAFDGGQLKDPGAAFIGSTLSVTVLLGVIYVGKRSWLSTPFAKRHPAVTLWSIFFASLIGDSAAEMTLVSFNLTAQEIFSSVIDHAVYQTAVLIAINTITTPLLIHRETVKQLEETQLQILATTTAGDKRLSDERKGVVEQISSLVGKTLTSLSAQNPECSIDALRHAADIVVRPLSHHLATVEPNFAPPQRVEARLPDWNRLLTATMATPLVRPLMMATTVTTLMSRFTVARDNNNKSAQTFEAQVGQIAISLDFTRAGIALFQLAAVFLFTFTSAQVVLIFSRGPLIYASHRARWAINGTGLIVISLMTQTSLAFCFSFLNLPKTPADPLLLQAIYLLPLLVVSAGVGILRAINIRRDETILSLETTNDELSWHVAKINEALWRERQQLSRWLHGPLQAAIQAGVIQLQSALNAGAISETDIQNIRRNIRQALQGHDQPTEKSVNFMKDFESTRKLWQGVCRIDLIVEEQALERLRTDSLCASSALELLAEVTANAAIHGQATELKANLRLHSDRLLHISIWNNGVSARELRSSGLGERILSEITLDWSLDFQSSGTRLSATLPLA